MLSMCGRALSFTESVKEKKLKRKIPSVYKLTSIISYCIITILFKRWKLGELLFYIPILFGVILSTAFVMLPTADRVVSCSYLGISRIPMHRKCAFTPKLFSLFQKLWCVLEQFIKSNVEVEFTNGQKMLNNVVLGLFPSYLSYFFKPSTVKSTCSH